MFRRIVALLSVWVITGSGAGPPAHAQAQRHDRITVVPRPAPVTLDGDLREWDQSGALDLVYDRALAPRFSGRVALMYDTAALYVGAHLGDDTPLGGARGCEGDCLLVRVALPGERRPVAVALWYAADRRQPVMEIDGARAGDVAFRADADGRGYTLEARLGWSRLHAARPPRAGESLALSVEPRWGARAGD